MIVYVGDTLESLELSAKKKEMTEEFNVAESSAKSMLRDEFLINMQKFASSISRTIQQIEGEVKLECPDLPELTDSLEENLKNEYLREQVSEARVSRPAQAANSHRFCVCLWISLNLRRIV